MTQQKRNPYQVQVKTGTGSGRLVLFAIFVSFIFGIGWLITHPKEKFGFPDLVGDNRQRDKQKAECKRKGDGGKWYRGGDLVTDFIYGPKSNCVKYRLDNGKIGGYCCYSSSNPYRT